MNLSQSQRRFHAIRLLNFTALVLATALLAGCVSKDTNAASPSPTADRVAGGLGTRMCINNNSSMNLKVLWRGFPDARVIPPGGQNCNSGYELYKNGDLLGTIAHEPTKFPGTWFTWKFYAEHAAGLYTRMGLGYQSQGKILGFCRGLEVGESKMMQADWLRAEVVRREDSEDNAELELSLTDSSGPIIAGFTGNCSFNEN